MWLCSHTLREIREELLRFGSSLMGVKLMSSSLPHSIFTHWATLPTTNYFFMNFTIWHDFKWHIPKTMFNYLVLSHKELWETNSVLQHVSIFCPKKSRTWVLPRLRRKHHPPKEGGHLILRCKNKKSTLKRFFLNIKNKTLLQTQTMAATGENKWNEKIPNIPKNKAWVLEKVKMPALFTVFPWTSLPKPPIPTNESSLPLVKQDTEQMYNQSATVKKPPSTPVLFLTTILAVPVGRCVC